MSDLLNEDYLGEIFDISIEYTDNYANIESIVLTHEYQSVYFSPEKMEFSKKNVKIVVKDKDYTVTATFLFLPNFHVFVFTDLERRETTQ